MSGLRLMAVIGGLLHMSHVVEIRYNHQPRVNKEDCIRPTNLWTHQAGESYSLLGERTGQWTMAIIDQQVPGTRLPGYSSKPTGVDVGAGGRAGESGQQQCHG